MLVLSRHAGEVITIGEAGQTLTLTEPIRIVVTALRSGRVQLGLEAQQELAIHREEHIDPPRQLASSL